MKKTILVLSALCSLSACAQLTTPTPAPGKKTIATSKAAPGGTVNIDGEAITVYHQTGDTWSASGGDNKDPERYIIYRKERAIELKSGCRIDRRLSDKKDKVLYVKVKCGGSGRA